MKDLFLDQEIRGGFENVNWVWGKRGKKQNYVGEKKKGNKKVVNSSNHGNRTKREKNPVPVSKLRQKGTSIKIIRRA